MSAFSSSVTARLTVKSKATSGRLVSYVGMRQCTFAAASLLVRSHLHPSVELAHVSLICHVVKELRWWGGGCKRVRSEARS